MNSRLPIAVAFALVWLTASITLAAGASEAAPAPTTEKAATVNPKTPAPITLTKSVLDSEPIAPRTRNISNSGSNSSSSSQSPDLQRVGIALALVIGLIFALRWFGKRLFQRGHSSRPSGGIQVLARSPIAPRQQIVLLRVGRRVIVVGDSGSQMHPLCEITDADEIASLLGQLQDEKTALPTRAFTAFFQRASQEISGQSEQTERAAVEQTSPTASDVSDDDPAISATRDEISGLMDKVRMLSNTLRKGSPSAR